MPVEQANEMPVDEPANETPVVATSAMLVEPVNETPVEQANEAPVAPNNEMSITVPPHLFGVVPSTTNSMEQINFYADLPLKAFVYADLPLKAFVKFNGNEIEIDQSNQACLPQGPPFFKWAIENLLAEDMIQTIHDEGGRADGLYAGVGGYHSGQRPEEQVIGCLSHGASDV